MKTNEVKACVTRQLRRLQVLPEPQRRAELAELRRGVGRQPGDLPALWGALLADMPEQLQGSNGPSKAEWAVYTALTLFALHQQGEAGVSMNQPGRTLGGAVRQLAEKTAAGQDWTESSVLRRFNALATADSMPEVSHHLRGMIQLLRREGIPLDYPQLAEDLYQYQFVDGRMSVCGGAGTFMRAPRRKLKRTKRRIEMDTKRLYVDFHVLQTVPPSCVNRDDTGSPKTAVYGGAVRARVSSQAWKHAMRMMFTGEMSDAVETGYRTKKGTDLVAKQIKALAPDKDALKLAQKVIADAGIKSDDKGTKALFFMSTAQAKALAELAVEGCKDKKQYKEALKAAPSADMALFGRMVADDPSLNYDAAAQVAHSISTHTVQNEFDYFTAVDDCAPEDNAGAGHLGTVEYNSATLYRYATVNVLELVRTLGAEQAAQTVRAFGEAFIRSMPTGKQNSFANRTLPDAVYVTLRQDQPVNLCGAFEKPVRKSEEGYAEPSKMALKQYAKELYNTFAEAPEQSFTVGTGLEELAQPMPLNTMLAVLEKAVEEKLSGNEV